MAHREGIEPSLLDLETNVLPLHYRCKRLEMRVGFEPTLCCGAHSRLAVRANASKMSNLNLGRVGLLPYLSIGGGGRT